jgi:hypothetical protein
MRRRGTSQLPLRFPTKATAATDDSADAAGPAQPGSGLVDTIRRTVESSPVFEESGVQDELLDGLTAAQDEMSRIKRENRPAGARGEFGGISQSVADHG